MKIGIYPGSFDPITDGHIDIIHRSLQVVDKLYVCVSLNTQKNTLFSLDERIDMIEKVLDLERLNVEVCVNNTLTVKQAKRLKATHIIRGLRVLTDFEYEFQMTHANRVLDPEIDTLFLMTDNRYSFLSSSTVKEIARFQGDLEPFLPPYVVTKLREKFPLKSA